jgi:hypothetical protein
VLADIELWLFIFAEGQDESSSAFQDELLSCFQRGYREEEILPIFFQGLLPFSTSFWFL